MAALGPAPGAVEESRLLAIPQELRDQILLEALQQDVPIPCYRKYDKGDSRKVKRTYRRISLSCKQLRQDCIPIFFESNTFEFWAHDLAPKIPDQHCRLIKSFDIHIAFDTAVILPDSISSWTTSHDLVHIFVRGGRISTSADEHYCGLTMEGVWKPHAYMPLHTRDERARAFLQKLPAGMKTLNKVIETGQGMGIKTLRKVLKALHQAS